MKVAVVFGSANGGTIHIQKLADDAEFPVSLGAHEINSMCTETASKTVSHFMVAPPRS
jgi:hypothetical protein